MLCNGGVRYLVRRLFGLGIYYNNQLINQHFEGLHLYACPHAPSHPACNIHKRTHALINLLQHWRWKEASLHFNERVVSVGTYVSNICSYLISFHRYLLVLERKTRGRQLHLAKRFGPKKAFFRCKKRVQNKSCKMRSSFHYSSLFAAHRKTSAADLLTPLLLTQTLGLNHARTQDLLYQWSMGKGGQYIAYGPVYN